MKLSYSGGNEKLAAAVEYVNKLGGNPQFWDEIAAQPKFDHTGYTGLQIATLMRDHSPVARVDHYTPPFWRHRKTNAYVDPGVPNVIHYNTKKLWRSVGGMVNSLVHEFVHVVDHAEFGAPGAGFTHRGQTEAGNENAAPNWIGDKAEEHYGLNGGGER